MELNDITHIIEGMGEVGSALFELLKKDEKLNLLGNDIDHAKIKSRSKIETHRLLKEGCDVLHICFPYSVNFEKNVLFLTEKYQAKETVIHSTVPPGTTQNIQKAVWKRDYARTEKARLDQLIVYSPVRGVHSRMLLDFKRYTKFWSCVQSPNTTKREPVLYLGQLSKYGIKTKMMSNPTVLELAKIYVDTSYYGWLILYAQHTKEVTDQYHVDWNEMWQFSDEIEAFLNNRPKMFPGEGIGGHCVLQNLELIADEFLDMVFAHDKHYRRSRSGNIR